MARGTKAAEDRHRNLTHAAEALEERDAVPEWMSTASAAANSGPVKSTPSKSAMAMRRSRIQAEAAPATARSVPAAPKLVPVAAANTSRRSSS
jgi:hypothetical protein